MVKHIDGNGYIHFIQVGGLNPQVCESQRVTHLVGRELPQPRKGNLQRTDGRIEQGQSMVHAGTRRTAAGTRSSRPRRSDRGGQAAEVDRRLSALDG